MRENRRLCPSAHFALCGLLPPLFTSGTFGDAQTTHPAEILHICEDETPFSPRLPHNRSLQVAAMLTALIQYFSIHQPPNTSFPIRRRDLQDDVWKQLLKQITAKNECFLISHKFSYSSGTKRNVVKAEESRWFEVKGRQMFWSVGGKQETNICHDQPPRPSSSADFNNV